MPAPAACPNVLVDSTSFRTLISPSSNLRFPFRVAFLSLVSIDLSNYCYWNINFFSLYPTAPTEALHGAATIPDNPLLFLEKKTSSLLNTSSAIVGAACRFDFVYISLMVVAFGLDLASCEFLVGAPGWLWWSACVAGGLLEDCWSLPILKSERILLIATLCFPWAATVMVFPAFNPFFDSGG